MRERRRLRMIGELLDVQRARRSGAVEALATARRHEQEALDEQAMARAARDCAQDEWAAFISSHGFAPEYGRHLGDRLVERESAVEGACARVTRAGEAVGRRQSEWQGLEAQIRAGESTLRRLRRRVERAREEAALVEIADRTTFSRVAR